MCQFKKKIHRDKIISSHCIFLPQVARWWNDCNIEHTLKTLWIHSEHTLILNTLWTHSEHTLDTLRTHSEHTLNTLWTYSKHTMNTLWTHSIHTLNTIRTQSEHNQNTMWTHSEHTLKICPRFDKIPKTLLTHWLSDMDPRDANAFKIALADTASFKKMNFYWAQVQS